MRRRLSSKCCSPASPQTLLAEATQLRDPGIDMIPAYRRLTRGANNPRHLDYDPATEAGSDWSLLKPTMR